MTVSSDTVSHCARMTVSSDSLNPFGKGHST